METAFGSMTTVLAVCMILIGLPAQIRKNKDERKCGQPLSLAGLALAVFISRAVYTFLIGAYYILVPDVLGVIFSAVILCQYFRYR